MHAHSRPIALLLLVTFLAAMSGTQGFAALPMAHPAGCHGPSGSAPSSPAPRSFQCCANGHHWAIPGTAFSPERLVAQLLPAAVCAEAGLGFGAGRRSTEFVTQSASPPPSSPLRI